MTFEFNTQVDRKAFVDWPHSSEVRTLLHWYVYESIIDQSGRHTASRYAVGYLGKDGRYYMGTVHYSYISNDYFTRVDYL